MGVTATTTTAGKPGANRVLGVISVIHWVSHYHLFVLPMLFPFLKDQLGVSYVELGFALAVFSVVSGLTQAPFGYLVDYIGARKILLLGTTLGGVALIMLGLHLTYPTLLLAAALLGIANSVYHPGDYAILGEHMDEARMGRAFSVHTFAGFVGGAMGPPIMVMLIATVGGKGALIVSGAIAPLIVIGALIARLPDAGGSKKAGVAAGPRVSVMTPAIMVLMVFFALLTLSVSGINNFGIPAMIASYGITYSTASVALTAFLATSAVGVLAGGYLADRSTRHSQIAAISFTITAVLISLIAIFKLPTPALMAVMIVAGFLSGLIAPSRDMLVRQAAPPGASGRAFGIVSTGFNIGGGISPLLFAWFMDHSLPQWVFGASAVFMALTVVIAMATERKAETSDGKVASAA